MRNVHPDLSSRGGVPRPGQQRVHSHLRGKEVDSASYDTGCDDIKARGRTFS